MLEVLGFTEWLNEPHDDLEEDDSGGFLEELGLRPDAPQEAVVAFNEYKKNKARRNKEKAIRIKETILEIKDRCYKVFTEYLDKSDDSKGKAIEDIGLVKDAPQEAIKAYKEYQMAEKVAKERREKYKKMGVEI